MKTKIPAIKDNKRYKLTFLLIEKLKFESSFLKNLNGIKSKGYAAKNTIWILLNIARAKKIPATK